MSFEWSEENSNDQQQTGRRRKIMLHVTCSVRPNHSNDARLGQIEFQVVDQKTIPEGLPYAANVNHNVSQSRSGGDVYLAFRAHLSRGSGQQQLVVPAQPRLALRALRLRITPDPLQFGGHGLGGGGHALLLPLQTLVLGLEPLGVVALEGYALSAIEFEYPPRDVLQDVSIVRYANDCALELIEELLEPGDALGIEVIRWLETSQRFGRGGRVRHRLD